MKRKLRSIIAAVTAAFMFVIQPLSAGAEGTSVKVTDRIAVTTAEELAAVTGSGTYYIYQDIDLAGFDWKGISDFSGTLYAYNYSVIKNLTSSDCGLFRKLSSGARIDNIHIENAKITTGTRMLGGLVSYIPAGSKDVRITNCSVNGMVSTTYQGSSTKNYCGGIAGVVSAEDCVISGCSSSAFVCGVLGEGGIAGLNRGTISECVFTGCAMNSLNLPPEDPNEIKTEEYHISAATGGISGVNYGAIENCTVLFSECGSAFYLGLVSGVNIKGRGVIKDSRGLKFGRWSDDGDSEYIAECANTVKAGTYSKFVKGL